jgi:hypothetical protein
MRIQADKLRTIEHLVCDVLFSGYQLNKKVFPKHIQDYNIANLSAALPSAHLIWALL